MIEVTQNRFEVTDQGTLSKVVAPMMEFYFLELPWKSNRRSVSCIPWGEYLVKIRISPKYGRVYHIQDVPNRSYILQHSGNWGGDISKGYRTHSMGCQLFGAKPGFLSGQRAVLASRITMGKFMREMDYQPYKLVII